jgi:hypothetical protein
MAGSGLESPFRYLFSFLSPLVRLTFSLLTFIHSVLFELAPGPITLSQLGFLHLHFMMPALEPNSQMYVRFICLQSDFVREHKIILLGAAF